jgi:RNAse (barnase) inhibitor barstar
MIDKYLKGKNTFIASIDGKLCNRLDFFLEEIGRVFNFPDYYGKNMNALNDCLNDLEWLQKENYILIINNFEFFFKENEDDKFYILKFLKDVSKEWRNVSIDDGYRKKSDFILIFN